jgi:hypothetical protein
MTKKKINETIPIVFNGGAYGTYLEWLLTTLTTDCPVVDPFTKSGNSHRYQGRHLIDMRGWNEYVNTADTASKFVRLHPKSSTTESISANLKTILSSVDRCIYIYPDNDSMLLVINNYFSKIWKDWWVHQISNEIGLEKIYDNWPIDPGLPVDQIPVWIQREFLSYYLMPSWYNQVEWYHLDTWQDRQCTTILVNQLLDDIEGTLYQIQKDTGLTWTKSVNDIFPMHQKMLSLQQHRNQDQLCQDIIKSVITNAAVGMDWTDIDLPLASQSYIQYELRNLNFEIECHNLDNFPTNSVHLKSIIYSNKTHEPI